MGAEMKFFWCNKTMDWIEIVPRETRRVHIIGDTCEVVSQADGNGYTSKSAYRRSLKDQGMVEMGNDAPKLAPRPYVPVPGVGDTIRRVAWEKGFTL